MEWKIFDIDGDSEAFFQWLLLSLAEPFLEPLPDGPGYARTVGDDLLPALRFLDAAADPPLRGPLRLYASLGGNSPVALLCGEELEEALASLRERGEGDPPLKESSLDPSERSWGIIGLALPGWVILFSEDVEEACQDVFDGGFSVAYLPVGADSSLVDPFLPTKEAWRRLFAMVLRSLPHRRGEGPLADVE